MTWPLVVVTDQLTLATGINYVSMRSACLAQACTFALEFRFVFYRAMDYHAHYIRAGRLAVDIHTWKRCLAYQRCVARASFKTHPDGRKKKSHVHDGAVAAGRGHLCPFEVSGVEKDILQERCTYNTCDAKLEFAPIYRTQCVFYLTSLRGGSSVHMPTGCSAILETFRNSGPTLGASFGVFFVLLVGDVCA